MGASLHMYHPVAGSQASQTRHYRKTASQTNIARQWLFFQSRTIYMHINMVKQSDRPPYTSVEIDYKTI